MGTPLHPGSSLWSLSSSPGLCCIALWFLPVRNPGNPTLPCLPKPGTYYFLVSLVLLTSSLHCLPSWSLGFSGSDFLWALFLEEQTPRYGWWPPNSVTSHLIPTASMASLPQALLTDPGHQEAAPTRNLQLELGVCSVSSDKSILVGGGTWEAGLQGAPPYD